MTSGCKISHCIFVSLRDLRHITLYSLRYLESNFQFSDFSFSDVRGPPVSVLQPCLKVLENLISPSAPKSKTNKDLTTEQLYTIKPIGGLTVDYRRWLTDDPIHSFDAWKARMPPVVKAPPKPTVPDQLNEDEEAAVGSDPSSVDRSKVPRMFIAVLEKKRQKFRTAYLAEKYGLKWRSKVGVLNRLFPVSIFQQFFDFRFYQRV